MSFNPMFSGALAALMMASPALADIQITDPYARSSNPMAGAAFMMIHNDGAVDDRLVGVASEVAARTELHTHLESAEGVMRMVYLEDGLDLPAGGMITLERGSDHVMFMGLTDPFEDGQMITLTFTFEQAGDVVVEVPVDQDRTAASTMDHGTMEGSDAPSHDH